MPQNIDYFFTFKHIPGCGRQFRPFATWRSDDTFDDAKLKLRNLLRAATAKNVGKTDYNGVYHVLLSGGLDSCITLHLLREKTDAIIRTYTLHYIDAWEGKQTDLEYARRLSDIYKTEHYEHLVTEREMRRDFARIVTALELPFAGFVSPWFAGKMMPRDNDVYTGDLSDELFGSYKGPREIPTNLTTRGEIAAWRGKLNSWIVFDEDEKDLLYNVSFKNLICRGSSSRLVNYWLPEDCSDKINAMIQFDWRSTGPDQVFYSPSKLMHQNDISPFMDKKVIDYVNSLPGEYKVKDGNIKYLLKETFKGFIPDFIIDRKKEGFVQPSNYWMKNNWKDEIKEICNFPCEILNQDYIDDIVHKYYSGDDTLEYKVWTITCFKMWVKMCGYIYGY
jgi:asparagine synthase (glutamine-hydrolysing)